MELIIEQIDEDRPGIGLTQKVMEELGVKSGDIVQFRYGTGEHNSRVWLAENRLRPKSPNGAIVSHIICYVYRMKEGSVIHAHEPIVAAPE